jgi:ATPase subunit of ABC transporter with duplicated ATPase domains
VLKIMAGLDQPSNGDAYLSPGYSVGILLQEPPLNEDKTVLGNVEEGVAETKALLDRFNEIAEKMAVDYSDELLSEMGRCRSSSTTPTHGTSSRSSSRRWTRSAARRRTPTCRFSPGESAPGGAVQAAARAARPAAARRADEPPRRRERAVARAAPREVPRHRRRRHPRPVLPRQRRAVDPRARPRPRVPVRGNYSTYLETKASRLKVEGQKDVKRQKRLKDELEWVRSNAKGRQAKSKARLQRYEEMAAEADKYRKLDFDEIQIPPGPRLGSVVVEASGLAKGFGDRVLMHDVSFSLPRGGIVGILGPNGVGKTTLFKMIIGDEQPNGGSLRVGETVKLSYVDQNRSGIDPKQNVWQVVSDGLDFLNVGHVEMPSRAYVSAFGFKGPDQQKRAGVLSGGERNRLNLALTLKQGGNVLLLDEPTNDLDVETLGSLENALSSSPAAPW